MARALAVLYETSQLPELRSILIELLDRGLRPSAMTPWVRDSFPITLEMMRSFHIDYQMNAALIRQLKKVPIV